MSARKRKVQLKATVNPKDQIAVGKLPLHLWPQSATVLGCLGLLEGREKYGRSNFRESGVQASVYYDAMKRHMDAWFEGEDLTPDTGLPHLANVLACAAILVEAITYGKLIDDRNFNPGGPGYRKLVEQFTPEVARIKEMFAGMDPKHYTRADNA